jgi:hypothetical protein
MPGTADRRRERRFVDGAETDVKRLDGRSSRGRILDVGSGGIQLWTEQEVRPGEHVSCRVLFARRSADMPLRVVWSRPGPDGCRAGAVYDPLIHRQGRLIDVYRMYVLHRRQRALDDVWAS